MPYDRMGGTVLEITDKFIHEENARALAPIWAEIRPE